MLLLQQIVYADQQEGDSGHSVLSSWDIFLFLQKFRTKNWFKQENVFYSNMKAGGNFLNSCYYDIFSFLKLLN